MLASIELPMMLVAATALSATLTDTAPAPPADTPTAKATESTWLSAKASTVTAPAVVCTTESSIVASRLPAMMFWA